MKFSEFETVKHIKNQLSGFKLIINVNRILRIFGLGSKRISGLEDQLKQIEAQMQELTETPQLFNYCFSDRGWISYDSLNHEFMKKAIKLYKEKGLDEAENLILEYYKPEGDNIDYEIMWTKALPALLKRYRFIEYAKQDYVEKRYYSTIPLLIMIIDGTVNEIIGKGFHSDKAEIDVWDSITNIDNGIIKIRDIFRKGRNKTREVEIKFPYRNGILHGMDLGYDNYVVAAKCWHFLFVVRDWALSKESEKNRREQFIKDTTIPSFKDLGNKLIENNKMKDALKNWLKREISSDYISSLLVTKPTDCNLPETIAINFLDYWKLKNYGFMGKMYYSKYQKDGKPNIKGIRDQFSELPLNNYELTDIDDQAAGITEIGFTGNFDGKSIPFIMRMIYEGQDGYAKPRNMQGGDWKIISVHEKR